MAEVKEMEKLLEGWKKVRLGEVITKNLKSPFKVEDANNEGHYPFFTSGNNILKHSVYLIDGENLFLSTGGSAYVYYYKGKTAYSTDTYSVKSKINAKYLYYYLLKKINFINFRFFIGSGLEHLQKDDFKNKFTVIFPSTYAEQHKITEILETVDNAIEKTDQIIEKYKRIKQGLMQDLLTKGIDEHGQIRNEETHRFKDSPLGRIPEEWEVAELGKAAIPNGIARGPFGGMLKKEIFVSEGYKVYEQGNAIYKSVDLGSYYVDEKKYKQMKRFAVKAGDFIISCSGTIGKIFMIPSKFKKGIINQALLKITIDRKKFDKKFFDYYFEWEQFQKKIIDNTQGGAMQNLVGINEFKKVKIPKPPLPEQHRIATVLFQVDEVIEREKAYKEKLERIKKGLMEDLLTGKVRVNHLIEEVENES